MYVCDKCRNEDVAWVLVWILSLMLRGTSPVSKRAGNPAQVEGSPSRILSTNCLWLTRHGRKTVWLTKLSQKLSLFLMFKSCLYWRWHFTWRNIFTGLISILNVGTDKRGQREKHELHSINTWYDISCGWFKEINFFCSALDDISSFYITLSIQYMILLFLG